jgi:ACR3 family arsenite efflux pump ArsB
MGMAAVLGIGVGWLLVVSAIDLKSTATWIVFWVWVVMFPVLFAIAWRREKKRGNLERARPPR